MAGSKGWEVLARSVGGFDGSAACLDNEARDVFLNFSLADFSLVSLSLAESVVTGAVCRRRVRGPLRVWLLPWGCLCHFCKRLAG